MKDDSEPMTDNPAFRQRSGIIILGSFGAVGGGFIGAIIGLFTMSFTVQFIGPTLGWLFGVAIGGTLGGGVGCYLMLRLTR